MTNQLNNTQQPVFETLQQKSILAETTTRPGEVLAENEVVYVTACGLTLVETAEDDEQEF